MAHVVGIQFPAGAKEIQYPLGIIFEKGRGGKRLEDDWLGKNISALWIEVQESFIL